MMKAVGTAIVILFGLSGFAANPDKAFIQAKGGDYVPRPRLFRDEIYAATVVIDGVTQSGYQTGILNDSDGTIDNADGQHLHDLSGIITGVTNVVYLTDDRGPGWWSVGADIFSASLTYPTRMLEKVQVNGYSWPLVADAGHVTYEYRDDDSTMLAGFTLRRTAAMTALSARDNRVEWFYLSNEFHPDADVANGLWPVRGEPLGAVLNSVE